MSAFRQIAKQILSACAGRERLIVRGPRCSDATPKLALTFDDGPHPEHTPRLLDLLEKLGLRATFFVIGQKVEQHPDLIRRMSEAGHQVANHTYSHSEPRITSPAVFLDEIRQTDKLLLALTNRLPRTVRPPKGDLNWAKLQGLWQRRKTVALWNVDPKDFRMTQLDEMSNWCHFYRPHDGDIVLLHDNHPFAHRAIETLAAQKIFEQFETTTIDHWSKRKNWRSDSRITNMTPSSAVADSNDEPRMVLAALQTSNPKS